MMFVTVKCESQRKMWGSCRSSSLYHQPTSDLHVQACRAGQQGLDSSVHAACVYPRHWQLKQRKQTYVSEPRSLRPLVAKSVPPQIKTVCSAPCRFLHIQGRFFSE